MRRVLGKCLLWAASTGVIFAQAPVGVISGTVTDESDAPIPGASIVIKNKTTGAERSLRSAEGGTKLTVLYQRNVSFYELRYGARSEDYRFGYAEIYLDRRGEGQGTLIPAAKVRLEGNNWVVEDFGEFPARLLGLRARGGVGVAR